jgi:hypothetical protein
MQIDTANQDAFDENVNILSLCESTYHIFLLIEMKTAYEI